MSPRTVAVSTFFFSRMIRWYPPDLREEFGGDMIDAFTESIEAECRRASWHGILETWLGLLHDLAEVVIPYHAARIAPIVAAIAFSIVFYGAMLVAIAPSCHK